jgi:hypothetical protein
VFQLQEALQACAHLESELGDSRRSAAEDSGVSRISGGDGSDASDGAAAACDRMRHQIDELLDELEDFKKEVDEKNKVGSPTTDAGRSARYCHCSVLCHQQQSFSVIYLINCLLIDNYVLYWHHFFHLLFLRVCFYLITNKAELPRNYGTFLIYYFYLIYD